MGHFAIGHFGMGRCDGYDFQKRRIGRSFVFILIGTMGRSNLKTKWDDGTISVSENRSTDDGTIGRWDDLCLRNSSTGDGTMGRWDDRVFMKKVAAPLPSFDNSEAGCHFFPLPVPLPQDNRVASAT